jgi:phosphoglycerate kinase
VLNNLIAKADRLLIGGAMANTFIKAQGKEIGQSYFEPDAVDTARQLIQQAKSQSKQLLLPVDVMAATGLDAGASHAPAPVDSIPADRMAVDIGPQTIEQFVAAVRDAKTVVWNGPMGVAGGRLRPGTRSWRMFWHRSRTTIVGGGDFGRRWSRLPG